MRIKHYYFGSRRPYKHNTFVGNVAVYIPNRAIIAAKLGLNVSRIKNFEVVDKDIKFCVIGKYTLPQDTWSGSNGFGLTYFDDRYGMINELGVHPFREGSPVTSVTLPNATYLSRQFFQSDSLLRKIRLDKITTIQINGNFYGVNNAKIYLPSLKIIGSPSFNDGLFNGVSSSIIYINEFMKTCNDGRPDLDLIGAIANGNRIVYVPNVIPPEPIDDILVTNITNTSVDISFTEPYSLNGIEFYEIFLDDVYYSDIYSNTSVVNGLSPDKPYKISVKGVDIYYNRLNDDSVPVYYQTTNI